MDISKATKERINQICKEKNYTLNKLSYKAGITQSTLNKLMKNKYQTTTLKTLQLICIGLNIELSEFFNNEIF